MYFLLSPLLTFTSHAQDPLLQLWLYELAYGTCTSMMSAVGIVITCIALLHYWYFKIGTRPEQVPESYAFEFAIGLLSRTKHGTLEYFERGFEKARQVGRETYIAYMPFLPTLVFVSDPAIIEHVLKTNFENYVKGPRFHVRLVDLLGKSQRVGTSIVSLLIMMIFCR
jgi:hypothetical protein